MYWKNKQTKKLVLHKVDFFSSDFSCLVSVGERMAGKLCSQRPVSVMEVSAPPPLGAPSSCRTHVEALRTEERRGPVVV